MSDADYRAFLIQVETVLPQWETELKNIDLKKYPQLSYTNGKSIMDRRDVGLMEIGYIRESIAKQRSKRSVYQKRALQGFLQSLDDVGG